MNKLLERLLPHHNQANGTLGLYMMTFASLFHAKAAIMLEFKYQQLLVAHLSLI